MVGLEAFRSRRMIVVERLEMVQKELAALQQVEVPEGTDTTELVNQAVQLMEALHIMQGRLLEVDAWIESLMANPMVERVDQLPTKGNSPRYEPKDKDPNDPRWRETKHRADAAELATILPERAAAAGAGRAREELHVRGPQLRAG